MITVLRIGTDTPDYTADDRTGAGAESSGGRWNAKGTPVLYTSESRALACVETLAHLSRTGTLPYNRYLVEYDIPEDSWTTRVQFDVAVSIGWDALPPGLVSRAWGTAWLRAGVRAWQRCHRSSSPRSRTCFSIQCILIWRASLCGRCAGGSTTRVSLRR